MLDAKVEYQLAQNHQAELRKAWQVDHRAGRNEVGNAAKARIGNKASLALRAVAAALIGILSNSSQ